MNKPLAIDLFCGLGGWAEGLLAEGYRVIGYDIEAHDYGKGKYPGELVIQDVLTLHGSQFKDAALIVASPPCQEFSYMAMPWSLAKEKARRYESGELDVKDLTRLFDACFRIQREAEEAAGHHIPLIVENVRGAQKWVGRAKWNFGSYYLWGDVPALMPITLKAQAEKGIPHRTTGHWTNAAEYENGASHETRGVKRVTIGGTYAERKAKGDTLITTASGSNARKAASAMIAKIPAPLARHIARVFYPDIEIVSLPIFDKVLNPRA